MMKNELAKMYKLLNSGQIVAMLRNDDPYNNGLSGKAADEIERLRGLLKESLRWLYDSRIDEELINKIEREVGDE